MKLMRLLAAMALMVAVTLGTTGCEKKGEGEKAGEAAGKAADDAGDAMKNIAEDAKKAVE